jgi:phosphotransferase system enzyme I (PtsI)
MGMAMVRLTGTPVAPGLAFGPLVRLGGTTQVTRARGSRDEEREALAAALAAAQDDLARILAGAASADEEGIIAFQIALLEDEELTYPAHTAIEAGETADTAWRLAMDAQIEDYSSSDSEYFRARTADLRDLYERVSGHLAGQLVEDIPRGAIVVADDLAPSRFLATDWSDGGLVLHQSGATSHVAILARARGVPMLIGVEAAALDGHSQALLDAHNGLLILDPDATTRQAFDRQREAHALQQVADARYLGKEARTSSGERVRVLINVAGPDDLETLDPAHVDGIGLVRTEFLFHGRDRLPDEEEQYRVYRRLVEWAAGKPVTIRTLDAGGDKPIPGLTREHESNPFLGVRGVRLSLRHPQVLRVQLRALARAAVGANLKVMIPMVTLPEELERCRELLARAVAELAAEGKPAASPPLGMMVEVPAAALAVEEFDAAVYSVGSNDLIQYLSAASRDEPQLTSLALPGTGFLRVIRAICVHGEQARREVSLCGDLASDSRYISALLECGLRTLSVAPAALAAVKATIAKC